MLENNCKLLKATYALGISLVAFHATGTYVRGCNLLTDSCITGNYVNLPFTTDRCPTCPMTSSERCDLNDVTDAVWYRAEFNMTMEVVRPYMCGSKYPIWLDGKAPEEGEGIVERYGCLSTFNKTCFQKYEVRIKNCGSFQTYCFVDLPSSCQQRFCFNYPEPPTTIPTTTSTTTTKDGGEGAGLSKGLDHDCDKEIQTNTQNLLIVIVSLSLLSTALLFTVVILCYDKRRTYQVLEGIRTSRFNLQTNSENVPAVPNEYERFGLPPQMAWQMDDVKKKDRLDFVVTAPCSTYETIKK